VRLFLALVPSEDVTREIDREFVSLHRQYQGIRWVPPENMHVTLRFFGEREPEDLIGELDGIRSEDCLPIGFTLSRSGTFGRPPSVIWLSGKFSEEAFVLASRLGSVPDQLGEKQSRPFRPHLTVARVQAGNSVPSLRWNGRIQGTFHAVKLMSSILTSGGPIYRVLKTFPC